MGQLAGQLRSSSGSLTHAISRMHSCGWVERHNDPSDRRAQFAALTDEGLNVLTDAAHDRVAAVRRHLFSALGPQQVKQLQKINQAIIDAHETLPRRRAEPGTPTRYLPGRASGGAPLAGRGAALLTTHVGVAGADLG